jgi:hypothetical protein
MAEHASSPAREPTPAPPSPGPTICRVHGLHYDSRINTGCVLCRREAEAPADTSDYRGLVKLVVITILVAAATGMLYAARKVSAGVRYSTPAAMVSGSKSAHAACYSECAQAHALCDTHCNAKGTNTCGDYCMSSAHSCFTDCSGRLMQADPPWSYYYGTQSMPAWSAVLESALGLNGRLLACSAAPPVSALAYVRVRGKDGAPAKVMLAKSGLSDQAHACALGALHGSQFAPSGQGDYAFLARFDARYDDARLLIAQTETEISALPRQVSDDPGDELKSRLFDAKILLAEREKESPPPALLHAELRDAKHRLARLKYELSNLQVAQRSPPRPTSSEAERLRREQERERAREDDRRKRERETREDLQHYRQLNREYRYNEERVQQQRMWEERYWDD